MWIDREARCTCCGVFLKLAGLSRYSKSKGCAAHLLVEHSAVKAMKSRSETAVDTLRAIPAVFAYCAGFAIKETRRNYGVSVAVWIQVRSCLLSCQGCAPET